MKFLGIFIIFTVFLVAAAFTEPGLWENQKTDKKYMFFTKSLYADTAISVKITCEGVEKDFKIRWMLRFTPCAQEYALLSTDQAERAVDEYLQQALSPEPVELFTTYKYPYVEYLSNFTDVQCTNHQTKVFLTSDGVKFTKKVTKYKADELKDTKSSDGSKADAKKDEQSQDDKDGDNADNPKDEDAGDKPTHAGKSRRKRADDTDGEQKKTTDAPATTTKPQDPKAEVTTQKPAATQKPIPKDELLARTWRSGYYVLIIESIDEKNLTDIAVTVSMKGSTGYISAVEWPLLIFYGVMGLVYIIFGVIWLVLLACNWRDLMKLQYWIGAVIFLGMLEKAVFYADYQSVDTTGLSIQRGAIIVAEIVSSLKRALARMLVIIVSVGFGIVRPRLGPTFHKVLFAGGLYFILATIDGCMRTLKAKGDQSTDSMLAAVPLAIVDASICWWILSSLVQTTRQLRLRRNIVKLNLYRHFTNTLMFAILAAIVFMIWSVIQIKLKDCITDWHELWIDEAFWHLLFSILLAIIMVLWRPSTNNQRYAFSPLIDAADDEDEDDETVLNDAFDVKTRKKAANGSPKQKQNSIEDDLKWVEDNIPQTLSDRASQFIESDEDEVMTVKYEMSKMQ